MRIVIIGQSFMLHQIRKMVGMAVAIMRGDAPEGCIRTALQPRRTVPTPMAPEVGLFLDECYYDAYNTRYVLTCLYILIALGTAYITCSACIDMLKKLHVMVWLILSKLLSVAVPCLALRGCRCYHPGGLVLGFMGFDSLISLALSENLKHAVRCLNCGDSSVLTHLC